MIAGLFCFLQPFAPSDFRWRRNFQTCHFRRVKMDLRGEMAEWLKAHAWKACIPQGIQGSNPCLSATTFRSPGNQQEYC
jgi:hypothetical protein